MNFNIFKRKKKTPEMWVTAMQIERLKNISESMQNILNGKDSFDDINSTIRYFDIIKLAHNCRVTDCNYCYAYAHKFRFFNGYGDQRHFKRVLDLFLNHFEHDHKDLIEANQK